PLHRKSRGALRPARPGTLPKPSGAAVATCCRVDSPVSWFPPHGCQWWREASAVLPAGERVRSCAWDDERHRVAAAARPSRRTSHVLQRIPHLARGVRGGAADAEGPLADVAGPPDNNARTARDVFPLFLIAYCGILC